MTKANLIEALKNNANLQSKAQAEKTLDAILEIFTEALSKGDDIALTGFGSFKVSSRAERIGRNPRNGEPIKIAASKTVKFTAGKHLKEALQK